MMKSKQIVDTSITEEQEAFKDIMHRFDFKEECIIEFFGNFLDLPDQDLKDPRDHLYKSIAKKLFPLES